MTFQFRPALAREGLLYELPRPLVVLRVQETWDAARMKVPLRDGDQLAGHSRNGVDIVVQGQVGSHEGDLKLTEQKMFLVMEGLREQLHVSRHQGKYRFYVYHDPASATYRHFRECSTTRFEYDLSSPHIYTYSAVIHADDPVLYQTGEQ